MSNDNLMTSRRDFMRNLGVATVAGATATVAMNSGLNVAQAHEEEGFIIVHGGTLSDKADLYKLLVTDGILANAPEGATLHLTGYFFCSQTIRLTKPVHLTGNGAIYTTVSLFQITADDITISNLKIRLNGTNGVRDLFGVLPTSLRNTHKHKNIVVRECVLENIRIVFHGSFGACQSSSVVGCTITKSSQGVYIGAGSSHISVDSCYIYDCTSYGVYVVNTGQTNTANNVIHNCARGILIQGNTVQSQNNVIANNRVYENDAEGIYCNGIVDSTTIANNISRNNSYGVRISRSGTNRPKNIVVSRNICHNNTSDGLKVSGGDRITVSTNITHTNTEKGLWISSSNGAGISFSSQTVVVGNQSHSNTGNNFDVSSNINSNNLY